MTFPCWAAHSPFESTLRAQQLENQLTHLQVFFMPLSMVLFFWNIVGISPSHESSKVSAQTRTDLCGNIGPHILRLKVTFMSDLCEPVRPSAGIFHAAFDGAFLLEHSWNWPFTRQPQSFRTNDFSMLGRTFCFYTELSKPTLVSIMILMAKPIQSTLTCHIFQCYFQGTLLKASPQTRAVMFFKHAGGGWHLSNAHCFPQCSLRLRQSAPSGKGVLLCSFLWNIDSKNNSKRAWFEKSVKKYHNLQTVWALETNLHFNHVPNG